MYGGIISTSGNRLPMEELAAHVLKTGSVIEFPGTESITNDDLLLLPCDILIPAALECVLHGDNASRIQAKVVAEAANLPTTPEADDILKSRQITVLPDILTNVGGVIVSYFEWVQNLQQMYWTEEKVNDELYTYITRAYRDVSKLVRQHKITFKEAAYQLAVERVARAEQLRGL
jgi:glutamate dehydrogenase/leucine dehydrogenase